MNRRPRAGSRALTLLDGRVRDITQSGESVIETEQGLMLVRGGLPGEQVRVALTGRSQGVLRGTLREIRSASPERIEPACGLSERCGGCPLMALEPQAQRALKLQRVQRALVEVCEPGLRAVLEPEGQPLHYRRRVRLSFRRVGARALIGYRSAHSHTIVDVEQCPVLEPALQQALLAVRELLAPVLTGSGELELQRGGETGAVVSIDCDAPVSPQTYATAHALAEHCAIAGVSLRVQQGARATYGSLQASSTGIDGQPLHAVADGFSQANSDVNRRLVELVVELAQAADSSVLELYAGHGNFTVALAGAATALCAVEADAQAAAACRANLAARALGNTRVVAGSADELALRGHFDVLVLDPPRAGAPALAALAARHTPERVVYVSCHMTTLGRDLRALHALGFVVDRAHVLDMFPQTAHVEAVVRLVRRTGNTQARVEPPHPAY